LFLLSTDSAVRTNDVKRKENTAWENPKGTYENKWKKREDEGEYKLANEVNINRFI